MIFKRQFIDRIVSGEVSQAMRHCENWEMEVNKIYPLFDAIFGEYQSESDAICWIRCMGRHTILFKELEHYKIAESFGSSNPITLLKILENIKPETEIKVYDFELVDKWVAKCSLCGFCEKLLIATTNKIYGVSCNFDNKLFEIYLKDEIPDKCPYKKEED